uniref:Uncharacterized protein n=1 Tax=Branchiostoma floridae TaxID=7739 RepID=C3ZD05_BRAFL|eukprot:XP_002593505.1 hypothetical protein BRAFLDRAFT_101846 [Branchiostoma floridae]
MEDQVHWRSLDWFERELELSNSSSVPPPCLDSAPTVPAQFLHRASTVPSPCLRSSSTVPPQFLHSSSTVPRQCPHRACAVPPQCLRSFFSPSTVPPQSLHRASTVPPPAQFFHSASAVHPSFLYHADNKTRMRRVDVLFRVDTLCCDEGMGAAVANHVQLARR